MGQLNYNGGTKIKARDSELPIQNTMTAEDANAIPIAVNDNDDRITTLENTPPGSSTALTTSTDVTNFNKNLSAADTDVQKALQTFNDADLGSSTIPILQQQTGSTIVFTGYNEYNAATPLTTGDITIDDTGALAGGYAVVYYNGDTEPNIIGSNQQMRSGEFSPYQLNLYHFYYNTNGNYVLNIQNEEEYPTLFTPRVVSESGDQLINLIFSNIDPNATSNLLERSIDNINFLEVGAYDGTALSFEDTGLTNGQTYYYRYSSYADGYKASGYATTSATAGGTGALFEETFNGTTIDTSKWDLVETINVDVAQDNDLDMTILNSVAEDDRTTYLCTKQTFTIGAGTRVMSLQFESSTGDTTGGQRYSFGFSKANDVTDNSNAICFFNKATTNTVGLLIKDAGVVEENVTASVDNFTIAKSSFKILIENTTIKFYQWQTDAWVLLGTTYTHDFTGEFYLYIATSSATVTSVADFISYDNIYVTDTDYQTQTP